MAMYDKKRRSFAAEIAWETRRLKKVQAGKMTFEQLYDIYGEYAYELIYRLPDREKYLDLSDPTKEQYESPEIDTFDTSSDEYYLTMYDISVDRIESVLENSAYNVYQAVKDVLSDIKQDISKEDYKRFLVEALPSIDDYFGLNMYFGDVEEEKEETNNAISKIIDVATEYGYNGNISQFATQVSELAEQDRKEANKEKRQRRRKKKG